MKACRMINILWLSVCGGFAIGSHADDNNSNTTGLQYQQSTQQAAQNNQAEMEANKEDRTRSWLAMQRSNTQATPYQDALSPTMAQAAQQRAEKSFTHAIPEKFIDDNFGE